MKKFLVLDEPSTEVQPRGFVLRLYHLIIQVAYTTWLILQHALPRNEFSFQSHKDKIMKPKSFLACDPITETCDLGITETLLTDVLMMFMLYVHYIYCNSYIGLSMI